MAGKIQLTPAELLAQSQEMLSLQKDFEDLFKQTESVLGQVNANWSANLANNFAGKLQSAQKAFSQITSMLGQGGSLAATSANTYETIDALLAKIMSDDVNIDVSENVIAVTHEAKGEKYLKEQWQQTGNVLKWIEEQYQGLSEKNKKNVQKILGDELWAGATMTYDIVTGDVGWDTAYTLIDVVADSKIESQAVKESIEIALSEETRARNNEYQQEGIDYIRDGNILTGLNHVLVGGLVDMIGLGVVEGGGKILINLVEDNPYISLAEGVLGVDLEEEFEKWIGNAHNHVDNFFDTTAEKFAEFEEAMQENVSDFIDAASDAVSDTVENIKEAGDAVGNFIKGLFD